MLRALSAQGIFKSGRFRSDARDVAHGDTATGGQSGAELFGVVLGRLTSAHEYGNLQAGRFPSEVSQGAPICRRT